MAKPKLDNPTKKETGDALASTPAEGRAPGKPQGTARPRVDADSSTFRRSITLQLGEDRSPNWETVTEKNRGVWREILSHPKTVDALGLAPAAAPGPPSPGLPAGAVGAFFNGLARLEALACSKIFKVKFADAARLLAFTEEEKAELVPVTQALADKWLPVIAEQYGAEFCLAWLLFSLTAAKVEAVRALAPKAAAAPAAVDTEKPLDRKEAVQ